MKFSSLPFTLSSLLTKRFHRCFDCGYFDMSLLKTTGKALADVIPGLGKFTYDADIGTVFITSGTGVIGYRVAMSLLEAGVKNVRVGIWRGDRLVRQSSLV